MKNTQASAKNTDLTQQVEALTAEVKALKEQQLRAQADYQNLVRRTQEDRAKLVKFATADLMLSLLVHFDHLEMAATQLKDAGLSMVLDQLQKDLKDYGLEEIKALGQDFDVNTMEAVDKTGEGEKVVKVQSKGYKLNGEVIRHAKVVIGE
jgi:molecular chaperone GrpE